MRWTKTNIFYLPWVVPIPYHPTEWILYISQCYKRILTIFNEIRTIASSLDLFELLFIQISNCQQGILIKLENFCLHNISTYFLTYGTAQIWTSQYKILISDKDFARVYLLIPYSLLGLLSFFGMYFCHRNKPIYCPKLIAM